LKILVVLPNWLGDAIMATPSIELLAQRYPVASFTFVGSAVVIEALKFHPKCEKAVVDTTKKDPKGRLKATLHLAKELGSFDIAITLRKQFHSSLLLWAINATTKIARSSWHASLAGLTYTPDIPTNQHLVLQNAQLVFGGKEELDANKVPPLKLYIPPKQFSKPMLGINAGATYGSAKRWYPERFAAVGAAFANKYDILIFGGPNEVEVAMTLKRNSKNITSQTT
jgi:heptosyltransferase-2